MIRPQWFKEDEWTALVEAGRRSRNDGAADPVPLVRLFAPDGKQNWLICEIDPDDDDVAYGLCDLGIGTPEEGTVLLSDLASHVGPMMMRIERDVQYRPSPDLPLSRMARMASKAGSIIF